MTRLWLAALCCGLALSACSTATQFGPVGSEASPEGRQVWLVPGSAGFTIRAIVYRPTGAGPFPMAILSHGSSEDAGYRSQMSDPDYPALAKWLVSRGMLVVIPQRPGHGQSGGPYLETAGTCEQPDFKAAGLAGAAVLASVIEFMRGQPFVSRGPVLLVGHSAGGWASLALASTKPDTVRAVVVFAAGRGGRSNDQPNTNCAPDRLIETAGEFGAGARAPVLWIYSENDSYFSPELGRRIAAAYSRGGSPSTFLVAPAVSPDGHFFVHDKQALTVLSAPLSRLLKATGESRQ